MSFTPDPPLGTDEDILARVGVVLGTTSRLERGLVVQFLDVEDRELPVVVPIDGLPLLPDESTISSLCWIITQVLDENAPGGSAVLTLTRPGGDEIDSGDRGWRDAITDAAAVTGANIRLMCLGTRDGVRVLPE
jgi:hypothetical protein